MLADNIRHIGAAAIVERPIRDAIAVILAPAIHANAERFGAEYPAGVAGSFI